MDRSNRLALLVSVFSLMTCIDDGTSLVRAQASAPSSHLVFNDNFPGDILINEVRVPKSGEATCTYYEALGWRGTGGGYTGIQAHPQGHLFLFSIWDHPDHSAPIRPEYLGPGTKAMGFGGEGTGLKSLNLELGWSTDVWYTLVARCWPVGDHTHFGLWSRAGDTKKWTHLVTMDVAAKAQFEGANDAFIEDWLNTGANRRTIHLRNGWRRKTDGTWFPFGAARYSVNPGDLEPGKRSYNYRLNWDGGVQRDESGEFYYMHSGGAETQATSTNPSQFSIKRSQHEPRFEPLALRSFNYTFTADRKAFNASWEVDETTTPPFACLIEVFNNPAGRGEPLFSGSIPDPHSRTATLNISSLSLEDGTYYAKLKIRDIIDRKTETSLVPVPGRDD